MHNICSPSKRSIGDNSNIDQPNKKLSSDSIVLSPSSSTAPAANISQSAHTNSTHKRTEAEQKFLELQLQREELYMLKNKPKSHRERIVQFNNKLSKMSDHYGMLVLYSILYVQLNRYTS